MVDETVTLPKGLRNEGFHLTRVLITHRGNPGQGPRVYSYTLTRTKNGQTVEIRKGQMLARPTSLAHADKIMSRILREEKKLKQDAAEAVLCISGNATGLIEIFYLGNQLVVVVKPCAKMFSTKWNLVQARIETSMYYKVSSPFVSTLGGGWYFPRDTESVIRRLLSDFV